MHPIEISGKNIVGEEPGVRIPSEIELKSRYKKVIYSSLMVEGRKLFRASSMYGKRSGAADRENEK